MSDENDVAGEEPPPPPPIQEIAPYFDVDANGLINFAPPEALDTAGNNLAALQQLHTPLLEASRELVASASKGNAYQLILKRAADYLAAIDKNLDAIAFGMVFAMGVRLESAVVATRNDPELPAFDASFEEHINSVLRLHGTFVLSSADGQKLIANEERYRRTPAQQEEAREAAKALAQEFVDRPDMVAAEAAQFVAAQAADIALGDMPERTAMLGVSAVRNVTAVITSIGILSAVPVLAAVGTSIAGPTGGIVGFSTGTALVEGLKKSRIGSESFQALGAVVDSFCATAYSQMLRFARATDGVARTSDAALLKPLEWLVRRVRADGAALIERARSLGLADQSAELSHVDNLDSISVPELRRAVGNFTASLRKFAAEWRVKENIEIDAVRRLSPQEPPYSSVVKPYVKPREGVPHSMQPREAPPPTDPGRDAELEILHQTRWANRELRDMDFKLRFWPMGRALYEVLSQKTGVTLRNHTLQYGSLAGANPMEEAAAELEALARRLPPSRSDGL